MKKMFSLLAALVLLLSLLPVSAAAESSIDLIAYSNQAGSGIVLQWTDTASGKHTIQRKAIGESKYTSLTTKQKGSEYCDSVSDHEVYLYRVKNESTGVVSSAVPAKVMVGVKNLKATRSGSTVKLTWTAGKYCDGYVVEDMYGNFASDDVKDAQHTTTGTSYTFKDVAAGVQHVYFVVPYTKTDSGKCYGNDETGVPMVRLATPTLSLKKNDGKVLLSWSAVKGADKYAIYRSTNGSDYTLWDTVKKTSYTNSKVTSGTRYYYKVQAKCSFYEKTFQSNKSGAKSSIPLTTPTLTLTQSNGSVKLSWNAVEGAEKYYIYRSTDGSSYTRYGSSAKTGYTNSSVTAGNTYYYKIKAVKPVNDTDWTSSYSAVKSITVLKAPTLSISKTDSAIILSWNAVTGAVKYNVYRSTDNKNFQLLGSISKTKYTNSKVDFGVTYYYKVCASCTNGSGKSSSVKHTVLVAPPTLTSYTCTSSKVTLQWDAIAGADNYYIYRSSDGSKFSTCGSTTKTSYADTGLTAGKTYSYYVKAVMTQSDTNYLSTPSQAIQATTLKK